MKPCLKVLKIKKIKSWGYIAQSKDLGSVSSSRGNFMHGAKWDFLLGTETHKQVTTKGTTEQSFRTFPKQKHSEVMVGKATKAS